MRTAPIVPLCGWCGSVMLWLCRPTVTMRGLARAAVMMPILARVFLVPRLVSLVVVTVVSVLRKGRQSCSQNDPY